MQHFFYEQCVNFLLQPSIRNAPDFMASVYSTHISTLRGEDKE